MNISQLERYLDKHVRPRLSKRCPDLGIELVHDRSDKVLEIRLVKRPLAGQTTPESMVARIKLEYFRTTSSGLDLLIDSYTVPAERNKRYNALLRVVAILLSLRMCYKRSHTVRTITSYAINWISAWSLLKLGFTMHTILDNRGRPAKDVDWLLIPGTPVTASFLRQRLPMEQDSHLVATKKPWKMIKLQLQVPQSSTGLSRRLEDEMKERLRAVIRDDVVCAHKPAGQHRAKSA